MRNAGAVGRVTHRVVVVADWAGDACPTLNSIQFNSIQCRCEHTFLKSRVTSTKNHCEYPEPPASPGTCAVASATPERDRSFSARENPAKSAPLHSSRVVLDSPVAASAWVRLWRRSARTRSIAGTSADVAPAGSLAAMSNLAPSIHPGWPVHLKWPYLVGLDDEFQQGHVAECGSRAVTSCHQDLTRTDLPRCWSLGGSDGCDLKRRAGLPGKDGDSPTHRQ
jgi:hypothetical protein